MTPSDMLLLIGAFLLFLSALGLAGESLERRDARRRNATRRWR